MATFKDKAMYGKITSLNIQELPYLTQGVEAFKEGEKQTQGL